MAGPMLVDRATRIETAIAAASRDEAAKARPIDREQIIRCINRPQGHESGRRFSENNSALEGCGGSSCGFLANCGYQATLRLPELAKSAS
jgi:hypothetical protein